MRDQRGSILVHVLITGLIVAVIAAGILRITLSNYRAQDRAATAEKAHAQAERGLSLVTSAWNSANAACSSGNGYTCNATCSNATCTAIAGCNCECTGAGLPLVCGVTASGKTSLTVTADYTEQNAAYGASY